MLRVRSPQAPQPLPLPVALRAASSTGQADAFDPVPVRGPVLPDLAVHLPTTLERGALTIKTINGKPHLSYAYSIANRGPGHLVVIGSQPDESGKVLQARQLAYDGDQLVQVREHGQFKAGGPGGAEVWHLQDTCQIQLEKEGLPGWSARANKTHFFMVNSGPAQNPVPRDPSIPAAAPGTVQFEGQDYRLGQVRTGSPRAGQRLQAGTFDRYSSSLNAPVELPEGNVDGTYVMTVIADPNDTVAETDEDNNVEKFRVRVAGGQIASVERLTQNT